MIKMTFEAKKKKVGNSNMVIIPKPFADILSSDKEYRYTIDECDDL